MRAALQHVALARCFALTFMFTCQMRQCTRAAARSVQQRSVLVAMQGQRSMTAYGDFGDDNRISWKGSQTFSNVQLQRRHACVHLLDPGIYYVLINLGATSRAAYMRSGPCMQQ